MGDKERLETTIYELLDEINRDFNKATIRKAAVRVSNLVSYDPKQKTITDYFS